MTSFGSSNMSLQGADELIKVLRELPPVVQKQVLQKTLRAGAKVIAEEIKNNAPGSVKDAVIIRQPSRREVRKGAGHLVIGFKRPISRIVHLIEFGTKPHAIKPKNGKVLARPGDVLGSGVQHPGTKARPFIRQAIASKGNDAINKMMEIGLKALVAGAKKAAGKYSKSGFKPK